MNRTVVRRALVSVSDKAGLESFAGSLVELGFELVSTGGTRCFLEEAGISVVDVAEYTGFPEIMEGRVKTLHPKVHGAILGRPDRPDDAAAIAAHGIVPFELVVCNLYPFEQTIARKGVTVPEAIEQIDIGGPSMVRSAAKNHAYVGIVSNPGQYDHVIDQLNSGRLTEDFRRELAAAAFEMTARYDRAIADYMRATVAGQIHPATAQNEPAAGEDSDRFPAHWTLTLDRQAALRYGENPHQQAAWYSEPHGGPATLAAARQRHGKELSFNNLLDLDAAMSLVREFSEPASVVLKHNNPCGCGIGRSQADAFERAYSGDPVSAFGSIVGFNRPVDAATADLLCQPGRFIEAIIAPGFDDEAFTALTTRPKWKKNVRLLECPTLGEPHEAGFDFRRVSGGLLIQDRDDRADPMNEWKCVTQREPTDDEQINLEFAWSVCRHVKSNAIVFARDVTIVGVGAGQMSRLDSVFMAAHKASERSRGGVAASDAFFPFRDGIDEAANAGITAVIQPGGSRNDEDVIAACNEQGLAMIFTGRRHFRH